MGRHTSEPLDCASAQWIGKRSLQEDAVTYMPAAGGMLGVVCDGMGGHEDGECASNTVITAFTRAFKESALADDIPARLQEALYLANDALAATQHEPGESGTTLLAVFIRDGKLWWISVGDSPLYLWSGADPYRMDRLNEDHSMRPFADKMYKAGRMSLQRALSQRSILRSAVMGSVIELIDLSSVPLILHPGDTVFACSDGLTVWNEILREPSFKALIAARKQSSEALVSLVMEQVKDMLEPQQDNATVWVAAVR